MQCYFYLKFIFTNMFDQDINHNSISSIDLLKMLIWATMSSYVVLSIHKQIKPQNKNHRLLQLLDFLDTTDTLWYDLEIYSLTTMMHLLNPFIKFIIKFYSEQDVAFTSVKIGRVTFFVAPCSYERNKS